LKKRTPLRDTVYPIKETKKWPHKLGRYVDEVDSRGERDGPLGSKKWKGTSMAYGRGRGGEREKMSHDESLANYPKNGSPLGEND